MSPTLSSIEPADVVFVSPHPDDVALSCPVRVMDEVAAGRRVLLVSVFGDGGGPREAEDAAVARALGAAHVPAPFLDAPLRLGRQVSLSDLLLPERTAPAGECEPVVAFLSDVLERARPRQLVLPLAVGDHVDHRIVHEAGARAAADARIGDVSYYEDRPYALIGEGVRLRLDALGWQARDADLTPRPSATVAWSHCSAALRHPLVRKHLRASDALPLARVAWRSLRTPRPVRVGRARSTVTDWPARTFDRVGRLLLLYESQFPALLGSVGDFLRDVERCATRLGHPGEYVERAWRAPRPHEDLAYTGTSSVAA